MNQPGQFSCIYAHTNARVLTNVQETGEKETKSRKNAQCTLHKHICECDVHFVDLCTNVQPFDMREVKCNHM